MAAHLLVVPPEWVGGNELPSFKIGSSELFEDLVGLDGCSGSSPQCEDMGTLLQSEKIVFSIHSLHFDCSSNKICSQLLRLPIVQEHSKSAQRQSMG